LLAQHGDECGQQGGHQTCHRDRLSRRIFLNRRGGRRVAWDGGLVESEENCSEEGRLFARIGLEVGMDIDDEGEADGGEQTGLQEHVR